MEVKSIHRMLKIADLFTLTSAFLFGMGLFLLLINEYFSVAIIIIIVAIFDLLDGIVARAMRQQNEFGMFLDGFTDILCFAVLPALFVFKVFMDTSYISVFCLALFIMSNVLRQSRIALKPKDILGPTNTAFSFFIVFFYLSGFQIGIIAWQVLFIIMSILFLSDIKYPNHREIEQTIWKRKYIFILIIILAAFLIYFNLAYHAIWIFILLYIFVSPFVKRFC